MRPSNWIEDLVFPAAVAVLTAAWVRLWVLWSVRAVQPEVVYPAVPALLLGGLLAGSALVTRALLERAPSLGLARALIVGLGLAALVGSVWGTYRFDSLGAFVTALGDWGRYISPVLLGTAACFFMWWRGLQLAVANWPQQHMERSFFIGIAALGALFAVNQSRPVITPGEAVATTVTLFGAGLGALALVTFENARRYHEATTGTRLTLNRYWLVTVASVVGVILLAALAAAALFSPGAYAAVGAIMRVTLDGLTFVVTFLLAGVIAFIIAVIFPIIQALMNFGEPQVPDEVIPFDPAGQAAEQAEAAVQVFAANPALAAGRQVVFVVLLLAGLVLLLWWSVRRVGALNRKDSDEVRESIATRELVLDQLRALFQRRSAGAQAVDPYLALAGSDDDPRLMVRRAYQSMLEWARTVAQGRTAGQTPANYGEFLARAVPQGRAAIQVLTLAYERARYASEPPSLAEARAAQGALNELQMLQSESGTGRPR